MNRLLIACLSACLLSPLPARADDLADEARRQVELAKQDFADGAFERAANAATSALRLDPTRREAFKIKGLALEQMGQDKEALAMLGAYRSLSAGLPPEPAVEEAVARLERKLEVRVSPVPAILGASGGIVAAGGFAVAAVGYAQVADTTNGRFGEHLGSAEGYRSAFGLHVAGLVAGGVGAGAAAAGLVSGLLQRKRLRDIRTVGGTALQVTPTAGYGPDGLVLGFTGRW